MLERLSAIALLVAALCAPMVTLPAGSPAAAEAGCCGSCACSMRQARAAVEDACGCGGAEGDLVVQGCGCGGHGPSAPSSHGGTPRLILVGGGFEAPATPSFVREGDPAPRPSSWTLVPEPPPPRRWI